MDRANAPGARLAPAAGWLAILLIVGGTPIDDRDAASKVTLNLFNELLRLQKTGTADGQTDPTLPVGP